MGEMKALLVVMVGMMGAAVVIHTQTIRGPRIQRMDPPIHTYRLQDGRIPVRRVRGCRAKMRL